MSDETKESLVLELRRAEKQEDDGVEDEEEVEEVEDEEEREEDVREGEGVGRGKEEDSDSDSDGEEEYETAKEEVSQDIRRKLTDSTGITLDDDGDQGKNVLSIWLIQSSSSLLRALLFVDIAQADGLRRIEESHDWRDRGKLFTSIRSTSLYSPSTQFVEKKGWVLCLRCHTDQQIYCGTCLICYRCGCQIVCTEPDESMIDEACHNPITFTIHLHHLSIDLSILSIYRSIYSIYLSIYLPTPLMTFFVRC